MEGVGELVTTLRQGVGAVKLGYHELEMTASRDLLHHVLFPLRQNFRLLAA
jgi:hypothetical protein